MLKVLDKVLDAICKLCLHVFIMLCVSFYKWIRFKVDTTHPEYITFGRVTLAAAYAAKFAIYRLDEKQERMAAEKVAAEERNE